MFFKTIHLTSRYGAPEVKISVRDTGVVSLRVSMRYGPPNEDGYKSSKIEHLDFHGNKQALRYLRDAIDQAIAAKPEPKLKLVE